MWRLLLLLLIHVVFYCLLRLVPRSLASTLVVVITYSLHADLSLSYSLFYLLSPPHTILISMQVLRTLVRSSIVLRRLQLQQMVCCSKLTYSLDNNFLKEKRNFVNTINSTNAKELNMTVHYSW